MSYSLKQDEPLPAGVRRIVREQLEKALNEMTGLKHKDEGAAVHATRKRIKKIRAVLRLVKGELGSEIFQGENERLREVARGFAGSRDARVQHQVLERLCEEAEQGGGAFRGTAAILQKEIADHEESFGSKREAAASALQQICDRLEGWPLEKAGSAALCAALCHTYRRGRRCFRSVQKEPEAENFHTWRKRVKDLWYQAQIMQNLNETVLCEIAQAAKVLGQQLGDLHDLAFLRHRLEKGSEFPEDERHLLLGLICARERALARVTLDLGARFFAEKPGALGRRLQRYAGAWAS